jgi:hypothetical protein
MLNKAKLLKELEQHTDKLFLDVSSEYELARTTWDIVKNDSELAQKVVWCSSVLTIPIWHEPIDSVYSVAPHTEKYAVVGVDGSQIYPDKHQGTTCSLVNIGLVSIVYGGDVENPVTFNSEPYVMVEQDDDSFMEYSVDAVNCHRQELELSTAYEWSIRNKSSYADFEYSVLCDGSLIFWHLESKEPAIKHRYLTCYLALLQQMYEAGIVIAGYISMPKSKDLVNILRAQLCNFQPNKADANKYLEHVVDAHVAGFFLQPYTRSTIFQSSQAITVSYPEHLQPYFFYLHVGKEVVRIEIPAWVAHDTVLLDKVSRLMLDQACKGNGYPVVLAEAHEQAVVKGPDREFFYHLIQKLGIEKQRRLSISPKSLKKRGIGI